MGNETPQMKLKLIGEEPDPHLGNIVVYRDQNFPFDFVVTFTMSFLGITYDENWNIRNQLTLLTSLKNKNLIQLLQCQQKSDGRELTSVQLFNDQLQFKANLLHHDSLEIRQILPEPEVWYVISDLLKIYIDLDDLQYPNYFYDLDQIFLNQELMIVVNPLFQLLTFDNLHMGLQQTCQERKINKKKNKIANFQIYLGNLILKLVSLQFKLAYLITEEQYIQEFAQLEGKISDKLLSLMKNLIFKDQAVSKNELMQEIKDNVKVAHYVQSASNKAGR